MRSLWTGLFMLWLCLTPSLAQGPCTDVPLMTKHWTPGTKGYEPVELLVVVPVAEGGDVNAEAKKAIVNFAIHGYDPNMRRHAETPVTEIQQCLFKRLGGKTDKFLIRIHAHVEEGLTRSDSYTLIARFILPSSLISLKPNFETESDSGELLRGRWQSRVQTWKYPVRENVTSKKGKRATERMALHTRTVPQLVLRAD